METKSKDSSSTLCSLCGREGQYTICFSSLNEDEKSFIEGHHEEMLPDTARICKRHQLEAKRYHDDLQYIPKWKGSTNSKAVRSCMFPNCTLTSDTTKISVANFAPLEQLLTLTGITDENVSHVSLCKSHYNYIYKTVNPLAQCASCQADAKLGKPFIRHSPDSQAITNILHISIKPDDVLCTMCYKAHLTLLNGIKCEPDTFENRLNGDIDKWLLAQESSSSQLLRSILEAAIFVGRNLIKNKAVLLSTVSTIFTEAYTGCKVTTNASEIALHIETEDCITKFNSRWLLNNLIIYLNDYLQFKCIHKRFGTMLYRRDGDILTSLSWALGAAVVKPNPEVSDLSVPVHANNTSEVLYQGALCINGILHDEIKRISEMPDFHVNSVTAFLDQTDKQLVNFLKIATQSVKHGHSLPPSQHSNHSKIAFIVCLLINCTNAKQLTPFHNILADIVETSGGSRELLRILNRLGCTSSPDTHDRFVTYHAEAQKQQQLWTKISPNILTVASVDNFDMLRPHSAIYQGREHRSYHGTTIQLVQPIPNLMLQNALPLEQNTLNTDSNMFDIPQSVSRRRQITSSPSSSPHKLGKDGPKRRRTIPITGIQQPVVTHIQPSAYSRTPYACLELHHFKESLQEKREVDNLDMEVFKYMFQKLSATKLNITLPQIRHFLKTTNNYTAEPSTIHYLNILSENADSDSTLLKVSEDLLEAFEGGAQQEWVLLVGDGKTYQHLTNIKNTYGESLRKLLIFPGDWHTLKNFQETIMKIYFTAGLKEIAEASGFRGATLVSLQKCSNFKRTHSFLMQLWEAMYRVMLLEFAKTDNKETLQNVEQSVQDAITNSTSRLTFMDELNAVISQDCLKAFHTFIESQASKDELWRFWSTFLFVDCRAYIYLFLSIRGRNWELRNASLKNMVPTFAAFDRDLYQKLVPNHIADSHLYPSEVLDLFKSGGFAVQITGEKWKAVALDEAHEMCINKDLKAAISHPTESYLQKTSLFLNTRIQTQKSFLKDLFPERNVAHTVQNETLLDSSAQSKEIENNVSAMEKAILQSNMLEFSPDRILSNPFSGQVASNEQRHDLLNFRQIGEEATQQYITHHILKQSSSGTAVRRKKLLTMASQRSTKKKTKHDRENETVIKCLRRRLAWCERNGQPFSFDDELYSVFPRALSDENGVPHKSAKSHWTDKLKSRYASSNPLVFSNSISNEFSPQAVVIDAMFLINTKPLRNTKTISQYTKLLFTRFINEHFNCGIIEIHVVFDKPIRVQFNPKQFEQQRRDSKGTNHTHKMFDSDCKIDMPWQEILGCRICKYRLVECIGCCFLQESRFWLTGSQRIILSGCFSGEQDNGAWIICSNDMGLPQPEPLYYTNAEEADLRVWRHAVKCDAHNVLLYSPDTDVSVIGLQILNSCSKKFVVQLNLPSSHDKTYLHLNNLLNAFQNDIDLSSLPSCEIPSILTALFLATGSDYTSYFKNIGKSTVLNNFFMHCQFITGTNNQGSLSDFTKDKREQGFLSFLRLVGTLYFKRHLSSFSSISHVETPDQLYHSTDESMTPFERHKAFILKIQSINSERIVSEEDRIPSLTALHRHWLRVTYICNLWSNATMHDVYEVLPLPEESGWVLENDQYSIDWEDKEKQETISKSLGQLISGCKCKKGCGTLKCGCKKKNILCGPGCYCRNCSNVAVQQSGNSSDEEESDSEGETDNEELETELITDSGFILDAENTIL